jgi:hypothetical protein
MPRAPESAFSPRPVGRGVWPDSGGLDEEAPQGGHAPHQEQAEPDEQAG